MKTVASKLAKCKLDVVAVQEVRWVEVYSQPVVHNTFFHGNGNAIHHLGTGSFIQQRIRLAVKKVELISDRMLYVTLKGQWCDSIVLTCMHHLRIK
jgi:hypothetical protein